MEPVQIEDLDFSKGNGLIPVVAQEFKTGKVLMHAYANREALKKTLESGYVHYWSRSRRKLWKKGETSGNLQKVKKILVDCDNDTLLIQIDQTGNACHTGEKTCFYRELDVIEK